MSPHRRIPPKEPRSEPQPRLRGARRRYRSVQTPEDWVQALRDIGGPASLEQLDLVHPSRSLTAAVQRGLVVCRKAYRLKRSGLNGVVWVYCLPETP